MERRRARRIAESIVCWFDSSARDLPWRTTPRDPYRSLVSEFMLQQTQVARVVERFDRFLDRFPTLEALAAADEDDVLAEWSGLGYYRRARLLHAASTPQGRSRRWSLDSRNLRSTRTRFGCCCALRGRRWSAGVRRRWLRRRRSGESWSRRWVTMPDRARRLRRESWNSGRRCVCLDRRSAMRARLEGPAMRVERDGRLRFRVRRGRARSGVLSTSRLCWSRTRGGGCCWNSGRKRGCGRGCGRVCPSRRKRGPWGSGRSETRSVSAMMLRLSGFTHSHTSRRTGKFGLQCGD